jgi:hypothetical protein
MKANQFALLFQNTHLFWLTASLNLTTSWYKETGIMSSLLQSVKISVTVICSLFALFLIHFTNNWNKTHSYILWISFPFTTVVKSVQFFIVILLANQWISYELEHVKYVFNVQHSHLPVLHIELLYNIQHWFCCMKLKNRMPSRRRWRRKGGSGRGAIAITELEANSVSTSYQNLIQHKFREK